MFTLGWSKDPGPTYLAGRLPAVFCFRGSMRELSVFVDESGDFGEYEKHAPYYIITMVFHNQSNDISPNISILNNALKQIGYGGEQAVHTEPLIRREPPYQYFQPNERRAIFSKLYYFTLNCTYIFFVYFFLYLIFYCARLILMVILWKIRKKIIVKKMLLKKMIK